MQRYALSLTHPIHEGIKAMSAVDASLSDSAEWWIKITEHYKELLTDTTALTRICVNGSSSYVSQQAKTMFQMALRRRDDGIKGPNLLALFLDPRPEKRALVQGSSWLIGDHNSRGNTDRIKSAQETIKRMAPVLRCEGDEDFSREQMYNAAKKGLEIFIGVGAPRLAHDLNACVWLLVNGTSINRRVQCRYIRTRVWAPSI